MKLPVLLAVMVLIASAPSFAHAQTLPGAVSPAGSTPVPANDNALIVSIRRYDPAILGSVQDKLYRIRTGGLSPALRGADPTPAETTQVSANPWFAEAYLRDPVATLMLLRWVNQELRRHGASIVGR